MDRAVDEVAFTCLAVFKAWVTAAPGEVRGFVGHVFPLARMAKAHSSA